jgi:hypothetical protein
MSPAFPTLSPLEIITDPVAPDDPEPDEITTKPLCLPPEVLTDAEL